MLLSFILLFLLTFETVNPGRSVAEVENYLLNCIRSSIDKKKSVKIDSFFQAKYNKKQFNGTVLYAEKGRSIYKAAFGYANFKSKDTLTTSSSFQLGSVSKPLTAFAVLLLVDQGKLSLDDTIETFFPNFPYKKISIQMLLTHRSGLPNYLYFSDHLWPTPKSPISNIDVINLMVKHKPVKYFRPNRKFDYSNTNYCILAAIVEKVSGLTFESYMDKYIFKPLEMNHTRIFKKGKNVEIPNVVIGYNRYGRVADNTYLNGVAGDKGVYSTVDDLLKWDRALYLGELLSRSLIKKSFQPLNSNTKSRTTYGLGWRIIRDDNNNKIVYHSGWWKGFKSHYLRRLDSHKTIIVLMNSIKGNSISFRELKNLL
jgi:CubicO group peptidase (beta-lactamase class C family)